MGVSEVGERGEAFLLDGYSEDSGGEKEEYASDSSLLDEAYGCWNSKADYRNGYIVKMSKLANNSCDWKLFIRRH